MNGLAKSGLHPGMYTFMGVVLIIGGIAAMANPVISTVAIEQLLGWILLIGGIARLIGSFLSGSWRGFFWSLLVGAVYLIGGMVLVRFPLTGAVSMTLILAMTFLMEGIFALALGVELRGVKGSGWVTLGGVVAIVLGILLFWNLPGASVTMVGMLFGINLIVAGVGAIMLAMAAKDVAKEVV